MALAKCIKPVFDNQATKFYDRGEMADIEPDSPLAKTNCFQFMKKEKPMPLFETESPPETEEVSEPPKKRGRPAKPSE